MSGRAPYVVDTSSLVFAWRAYPIDQFEDLWGGLHQLCARGRLRAPEMVRDELDVGGDDLADWANDCDDLYVAIDEEQQQLLQQLVARFPGAAGPPGRKNYADPWVVVLAQQLSAEVVTEEKGKGLAPGQPKIPQMCKEMNLQHRRFPGLFAAENWQFARKKT